MGPFESYSFETSHAALVGGTTTIVDFAPQFKEMTLLESLKEHDRKNAVGKASCDYSYHVMVMDNDEELLMKSIPELAENGVANLKFFMAYKGTPFYANDQLIIKGMKEARKYGLTVMLHCENGDFIEVLAEECKEKGITEPIGHSLSRPPIVEDEATFRGIQMAKISDCPLYIVHVSTKNAMNFIKEAQEEGYSVYGETCTHYLTLDDSNFLKDDFEGGKYVCAPALRPKEHLEALWDGVDKGYLKAVGSDNAAVIGGFEAKKRGKDDFTKIPNGCPGMQNRLYMLWTQGVMKNRITKQKFVELTSTNPAKVCGFYPQKGALLPGSDADIVIYNPKVSGKITFKDNYEGSDYETYEGFERSGICEKVFLRGKLVAENGKFVGEKGKGKYIKQNPYALPYERYIPRD
ncbi:dihydropyrimidinase [Lagierella sp.]|uniref:dihydropyrimidinase n=1 Tax=Lagierella sp. TaxID=2849657 RepID=UPI00262C671A|nr:dihydropyrimidinase [Lagierella sp.]